MELPALANNGTFAAPSLAERFRVVSPHDAGWANVTHEPQIAVAHSRASAARRRARDGAWRSTCPTAANRSSSASNSYEKLGAAELTRRGLLLRAAPSTRARRASACR